MMPDQLAGQPVNVAGDVKQAFVLLVGNEIYEYDTQCIGKLMENLQYMIDVDASECAVQKDYDREMDVVRRSKYGSKGVNALVAGVGSSSQFTLLFVFLR